MFFKVEYVARPFLMDHRNPLKLEQRGTRVIHVTVRAPTVEEQQRGCERGATFCLAEAEWEPPPAVVEFFNRIDTNQVFDPTKHFASSHYTNPRGERITVPHNDCLPDFFNSFVKQVKAELGAAAQRAFRLLRWRTAQSGPARPFSSRLGSGWSFDGVAWSPFPNPVSVHNEGWRLEVKITDQLRDEMTALVLQEQDEPIYHLLFREASQQRSANVGSAIVIGMTALEVAVKSLISSLVPEARWLAMHVPTPPVDRMLGEYLPRLPARQSFNGKVKAPPYGVLKAVKKGTTIRNSVAHRGEDIPERRTLEEILAAIEDCLWLCDYYRGHAWARAHLSPETIKALEAD